jgi:hypothetical protein
VQVLLLPSDTFLHLHDTIGHNSVAEGAGLRRTSGPLAHAEGAIACVVRGETEVAVPAMLAAAPRVAGVVTAGSNTPRRKLRDNFKQIVPARDLTRRRREGQTVEIPQLLVS